MKKGTRFFPSVSLLFLAVNIPRISLPSLTAPHPFSTRTIGLLFIFYPGVYLILVAATSMASATTEVPNTYPKNYILNAVC
ncbi:hypothetical protein B0H65DRAFT_474669 [Neurospora tetraspora]|uniref:Uncharacterized protein n=1 Tax=Neurospora tetraspora TaxID=94610 RepID=A0AAE0J894_9PEZI|nr:hypothetical protein B0H65DRAFT_474669 [Neurospora tetraspora]